MGATETARKAGTKAAKAVTKTAASAKAVKAAKAGRVDEARRTVKEADLGDGVAAKAVAKAEDRHYQVEVNKRGMSTKALTNTLSERWESGWRLAHIFEQRGNTVLIFEKLS